MVAVQCPYVLGSVVVTSTKPQGHRPAKTSRIELRATEDDRDLLDRAAAALGTDRSSFLLSQGRLAAQRVLADRQQFVLDSRRPVGMGVDQQSPGPQPAKAGAPAGAALALLSCVD